MFGPIERRNAAGDVVEWLSILECPSAARLYIESGDETASFDLDDATLDEAITQLCVIRTNRRVSREVQSQKFEAAASLGYGDHDAASVRRSADGDRLIDRVR